MNKKVVVFGGGTGMSYLLRGLKEYPLDITAVVSVCDDGGSTGILRDELNMLAVGDIRKVLIALSKKEGDYEYSDSGIWSAGHESNLSSITSLVELKKLENYLISGGSDKIVRIFSISKYDNNCRITKEKEFENGGIILDIFQLSNGRIAYSTSNNTI